MAAFRGERAVSPSGGAVSWVVVDDGYVLHAEAAMFLASLRGRDLSPNTERAYAGRVALYLSFCEASGVDWRCPGLWWLTRFRDWLVAEPLPGRGGGGPRFRSEGAANAVLTAVCEFLRFGCANGWVPSGQVAVLSQPRYLRHMPPGYDAGESGQFRLVRGRALRFRVAEPACQTLTAEQVGVLIRLAGCARDRFLIRLLDCTGMRIGEALGMRRQDVHLLPDSRGLGCDVGGPHVHVRRRRDNANGALAKARFPRSVPVTGDLAGFYGDYLYERDLAGQAAGCDMVFVNLFREPAGAPMTYGNAKDLFDRLSRRAGFTARPHMLRHFLSA